MKSIVSCLLLLGLLTLTVAKIAGKQDDHDHGTLDWWEAGVFYQIYPRSFMDTNGDGVGDIPGISNKLEHLVDLGVDGVWFSPLFKSPMKDFGYDISDFTDVDEIFGTLEDLEKLIAKAKELGIKVILDFVPNHTSDQHEWFKKSLRGEPGFEDYYVWREGNSSGAPPNNWQSVFHTAAWTKPDGKSKFYLHQFDKAQPDLNYENPAIKEEMIKVIEFWFEKGVNGFRVDAINHAYEDQRFLDEPVIDSNKELSYENLDHIYTLNLDQSYELIYDWRELFDRWSIKGNQTKIMMTEAYASLEDTMRWYGDGDRNGSHFPFNFAMINRVDKGTGALELKSIVDEWLDNMPKGVSANWVLGNHDRPRIASRFGRERAASFAVLEMTLPGIAVVYYGEEIGMEDNRDITFEETQDPQATNTNKEVYQLYTRDPVRTPFQWDNSTFAGFTVATTEKTWLPVHPNYKEVNLAAQKEDPKSIFKLYQQLIKLRKDHAFMHGDFKSKALINNVFGYTRMLADHTSYAVVINMNIGDVQLNLKNLDEKIGKAKVRACTPESRFKVDEMINNVEDMVLSSYDAVVFEISGSSMITGSLMLLLVSVLRFFLH
ncbi:maltase 1-like isoform X3 [Toxorhynchites rutilus septentrionalis]|uniref:maltase 1-like isoform X3 n=1 Tax=Toxorhynchites rutilus septentrionalis TaxID=329112 RepID=UPI00247A8158|nr:maltase 1-like isoform X3 [Toxorhynchites rutilus septentrionalis]